MRSSILSAGCLALVLLGGTAQAQEFRAPPAPSQWVTDNAAFISEPARTSLNARLERFERDTGHQVIVWIGHDTGGVPLEDWAVRVFKAWGIGRKGKDDGAAVFVFAGDRRLRIEVGYGLEGAVPDAVANRIIQEGAVPFLRSGDPNSAITATVDGLLGAIGGEAAAAPGTRSGVVRPRVEPKASLAQKIVFGILGILLLIFFVTHPRLALFLLFQMMNTRGGRGGGWGGGGGFGGGGGRSGGGGASGSW